MTQTHERSARPTSLACEGPSGPEAKWRREYILLVGVLLVGRSKHLIPTHPIPSHSNAQERENPQQGMVLGKLLSDVQDKNAALVSSGEAHQKALLSSFLPQAN